MSQPTKRRGSVIVIVALALVALLMFAALAIDLAVARLNGAQLQATVDAAALAGAARVTGGTELEVDTLAVNTAALNFVGGSAYTLTADEVVIGDFDFDSDTFTPAAGGNFVEVTSTATFPTFFAGISGISDLQVTRTAVAEGGTKPINCNTFGETLSKVHGTSVTIDSYDSGGGAGAPYPGYPANDAAGLCTNGDFDIGGGPWVMGDIAAGVDAEMDPDGFTLQDAGNISGEVGNLSEEIILPELVWPDPPPSKVDPAITLNNGDYLALGGGVYNYSKLTINGGGLLEILGDADIRIADAVSISGTFQVTAGHTDLWAYSDLTVNASGLVDVATSDPHALTIYVAGTGTLNGGGDFYGAIISEGDLNLLGDASYYGAFIS